MLIYEEPIVRSCCYATGKGILTVGEYLLVTANGQMYVWWSILGLWSCVLFQFILLIKRNIIVILVVVLWGLYREKKLLCKRRGILTVEEYLLVTAYAPKYAYWYILGLYSCVLLKCIILIKRETIITCVVVLWGFYREKLLLCEVGGGILTVR